MLPFDRLCIGSLEHLWYQESFIALDEANNIISMGGHQVKCQKIRNCNLFSVLKTPGGKAVAAGDQRVPRNQLRGEN